MHLLTRALSGAVLVALPLVPTAAAATVPAPTPVYTTAAAVDDIDEYPSLDEVQGPRRHEPAVNTTKWMC